MCETHFNFFKLKCVFLKMSKVTKWDGYFKSFFKGQSINKWTNLQLHIAQCCVNFLKSKNISFPGHLKFVSTKSVEKFRFKLSLSNRVGGLKPTPMLNFNIWLTQNLGPHLPWLNLIQNSNFLTKVGWYVLKWPENIKILLTALYLASESSKQF